MSKTPAQRLKKHGAKADLPNTSLPPLLTPRPSSGAQGKKPASENQNNAKLIVIAGVAASLFLFWYLHVLTLNQMTQLSSGLAMPDALIGGFDPTYIGHLRDVMDSDARGQLSYLHKTAGTLFPLIFLVSWLLLIGTNMSRGLLRRVIMALPVAFAAVRIAANMAIDSLFGSSAPDAGAVTFASILTVAGWVLLLASVVAAAVALFDGRRKRNHVTTPAAG
ncbi:hypothetical protein ACQQCD_02280 [Pseudarthrobacter sp. J1763]|uniref:hypothetical protein n=1 Tax=Pseudarthrobacter sp. J1763 TaxID=3420445 RepID=UPI003D26AF06